VAVLHAGTPVAQDAVEGTAAVICAGDIPNGMAVTLLTAVDVGATGNDQACGARLEASKSKHDMADFVEIMTG